MFFTNKIESLESLNDYNNEENILIYKEFLLDYSVSWNMKSFEIEHTLLQIIDPIKLYNKFKAPEILEMEVLDMSAFYDGKYYDDTLEELHKYGFKNITKYIVDNHSDISYLNEFKLSNKQKGLYYNNVIITTIGYLKIFDENENKYSNIKVLLNNYNAFDEPIFNEGLKKFSIVFDNTRFGETGEDTGYDYKVKLTDIKNILSYLPNSVEEINIENCELAENSFNDIYNYFPNTQLKYFNGYSLDYYINNYSDTNTGEPNMKNPKLREY